MTMSAEDPFGPEQLSEILRVAGFPLPPEELAEYPDRLYTDWGLDSLGQLEMAAGLERRYGVLINDDDAFELVTPRTTLERVAALRENGKVPSGSAD
jgi:acyl carrier protein